MSISMSNSIQVGQKGILTLHFTRTMLDVGPKLRLTHPKFFKTKEK